MANLKMTDNRGGISRRKKGLTRPACRVGFLLTIFNLYAVGQAPPTQVSVASARTQTVSETISLVGSVKPTTRSVIASEVAGLVRTLEVEEGDVVEKGQTICRLRDTTAKFALAEAQAKLQELQERLAELKAGTRPELIEQAQANMQEAQALYENWENELQRVTRLFKEGQASQKEYNDTVAEHAAARQRYSATKALYALAQKGPRREEIAQAEFAVEAQKAAVANLKYSLEQTRIKAPFGGVITKKLTEVGQWITAGGSVVEMIDLDHVLVRVNVPESAISFQEVGDQVSVIIDALDKTFWGKIKHIIPQADENARTFPVEIEVDNSDRHLKSGMFARARIASGQKTEAVVVPRDAVIQRQGAFYVVSISPAPQMGGPGGGEGKSAPKGPAEGQPPSGKPQQNPPMMATPIPVLLGAEIDNWIAVRSPAVQAGMKIAVKGHDRIFAPMPVIPLPATWVKPPGESTAGPATQPAPQNVAEKPNA
jgi:multidrug efflux pump subunit AcrA (membrane-fusion protein)